MIEDYRKQINRVDNQINYWRKLNKLNANDNIVLKWLMEQLTYNKMNFKPVNSNLHHGKYCVNVLTDLIPHIKSDTGIKNANDCLKHLIICGYIELRRQKPYAAYASTTQLRINPRPNNEYVEDCRSLNQILALFPKDSKWHTYKDLPDTVLSEFDALLNLKT